MQNEKKHRLFFVNGYYNDGKGLIPEWIAKNFIGLEGCRPYWGGTFISKAEEFLKADEVMFIDGRGAVEGSGTLRFIEGCAYADRHADLFENCRITFVTHSMGAAYAEGIIRCIAAKGADINKVIHLSPADPDSFTASWPDTVQLNLSRDCVLAWRNFGQQMIIQGVKRFGLAALRTETLAALRYSHIDTKYKTAVWDMIRDLMEMELQPEQEISAPEHADAAGKRKKYTASGKVTEFSLMQLEGSLYAGCGAGSYQLAV